MHDGIEDRRIFHISAGKRIRDIRSGLVESNFSDIIRDSNADLPTTDIVLRGVISGQKIYTRKFVLYGWRSKTRGLICTRDCLS